MTNPTIPTIDSSRSESPGGSSRTRRLLEPLVAGGVVAGLTVALHVRDPHTQGSWGFCPFKALTGLDCPGCGGLRAVNDLGNLELASAASSNLLFVLAVPLLVALWLAWARRAWRGGGPVGPPTRHRLLLGQVVLLLTAVFTVVRNLPFGGWLAA